MMKKLYLVAIGLCMFILSCYLTMNVVWMLTSNTTTTSLGDNKQWNIRNKRNNMTSTPTTTSTTTIEPPIIEETVLLFRCDKTFAVIKYLPDNNATININQIDKHQEEPPPPSRPFSPVEQLIRPHNNNNNQSFKNKQYDQQQHVRGTLRLTNNNNNNRGSRRTARVNSSYNGIDEHSSESSDQQLTGRYLQLFNAAQQQQQHHHGSTTPNETIDEQTDGDTLSRLNLMPLGHILSGRMTDCYLVDINKRPQEMAKYEDVFNGTATQLISFDAMLTLVIECRRLDELSLSNKEVVVEQPLEPPTQYDLTNTVGNMQQEPQNMRAIKRSMDQSLSSDQENNYDNNSQIHHMKQSLLKPRVRSATMIQQQQQSEATTMDTVTSNTNTTTATTPEPSLTSTMMGGIAPGTLWCGLGDRARGYSQLGKEADIDACCRSHDHCPVRLKPFTYDYGLSNWSVYTRSHCKCDLDLNDCLSERANSTLAQFIRLFYFKFVGTLCIELYSPSLSPSWSTSPQPPPQQSSQTTTIQPASAPLNVTTTLLQQHNLQTVI